jgi:hypothetical protein
VLVEREHLASECPTIVDRYFQPPVDEAKHFTTF